MVCAQTGTVARTVDPARDVVLLVNDNVPDSLMIAKYYCGKRGVPEANICRVRCTEKEVTTWPDFREQVLKPFKAFLEKFPDAIYVVPTWGVPSRISEEKPENDAPKDQGDDTIAKFVTNRDYCCLDAELALVRRPDHPIEGWIENDLYTKNVRITKDRNYLMVSRLDGPTAAIARGLVDKAIYAETYGLEGQNYLDTRGLPADTAYGYTDEEMRQTVKVFDQFGLKINHEDTATLQDVSALKDCLFYWGWYAGDYNGTQSFRFRTGAVSAHLHSCSACSIRTDTKFWVGPFLAHGVTCTTGTVYEPLTAGFPRMFVLYDRLFRGYTWGEASAMSLETLSWMAVFCGDPLYAPFSTGMKERQEANRALASGGYGRAAALVDAGDLDGAVKVLEDIGKIGVPFEGAQDTTFLVREIAARRITAGTAPVADLVKALDEARSARKTGDLKAAEAGFLKAATISPMNFDANLALGTLQAEAGKFPAALPFLEKARKVAPEAPELAPALGQALAAMGRFKEAIPILEAAVAAGGGPECLPILGDCYLKAQNPAKAIEVLSEAVRVDPGNRGAVLALAKAYEGTKDYASQVRTLGDAVRILPAALEDIATWKAAWKSLAAAADRAKDKAERERAALVLRDLDSADFAPPSRGQSMELAKTVDGLTGEPGAVSLGNLPARDLKVMGLPRVLVGNANSKEITVWLKGPCSRTLRLKPFAGTGKAQAATLGIIPGEYEVVVLAVSGKEKTILVGRKTFEVGKEYGLVVDQSLAMTFPK